MRVTGRYRWKKFYKNGSKGWGFESLRAHQNLDEVDGMHCLDIIEGVQPD